MRGGVAGVDLRAALALEQGDATAVERQQIGGGQSGDAAADDDDVDRPRRGRALLNFGRAAVSSQ